MHPLTNSSADTETEMISFGSIGTCRTLCGIVGIALVAFRSEFSRVGIPSLIVMDGPDIVQKLRTLGNEVSVVFLVLRRYVGDCAGDGRWHPSQGFFDHRTDIWEVVFVLHGGESVGADDTVHLFLCFLKDMREDGHCLNPSYHGGGRGI